MKYKKFFLIFISICLLSCSNDYLNTSSSIVTSNSNESSLNSTKPNDNKTIITFETNDNDINNWFKLDNNIGFKLDNENCSNITDKNNYIELSKDNNISSLSFFTTKVIKKIIINLLEKVDINLSIGIINKYNVKAEFKLLNNDNVYFYEFADYLSTQHIYLETKINIVITSIELYF